MSSSVTNLSVHVLMRCPRHRLTWKPVTFEWEFDSPEACLRCNLDRMEAWRKGWRA